MRYASGWYSGAAWIMMEDDHERCDGPVCHLQCLVDIVIHADRHDLRLWTDDDAASWQTFGHNW